jgi:hypothetical protein
MTRHCTWNTYALGWLLSEVAYHELTDSQAVTLASELGLTTDDFRQADGVNNADDPRPLYKHVVPVVFPPIPLDVLSNISVHYPILIDRILGLLISKPINISYTAARKADIVFNISHLISAVHTVIYNIAYLNRACMAKAFNIEILGGLNSSSTTPIFWLNKISDNKIFNIEYRGEWAQVVSTQNFNIDTLQNRSIPIDEINVEWLRTPHLVLAHQPINVDWLLNNPVINNLILTVNNLQDAKNSGVIPIEYLEDISYPVRSNFILNLEKLANKIVPQIMSVETSASFAEVVANYILNASWAQKLGIPLEMPIDLNLLYVSRYSNATTYRPKISRNKYNTTYPIYDLRNPLLKNCLLKCPCYEVGSQNIKNILKPVSTNTYNGKYKTIGHISALSLSSDIYVNISDNTLMETIGAGPFSLSCIFQANSLTYTESMSQIPLICSNRLRFMIGDETTDNVGKPLVLLYTSNTDWYQVTADTTILDLDKHFFCITRDSDGINIYIDGRKSDVTITSDGVNGISQMNLSIL